MEAKLYQVRWTDSRKSITYHAHGNEVSGRPAPRGEVHKEVMEHEFRIRSSACPWRN